MSPFGVLPTSSPLSAWRRWALGWPARTAPAPQHILRGRCPPGSSLYCRLYALSPRGDGTFDPSVVGYIVPGGTFQVGSPQVVQLRTDQPGSFGLQSVQMVPVVYGSASGWMPAGAFESVP